MVEPAYEHRAACWWQGGVIAGVAFKMRFEREKIKVGWVQLGETPNERVPANPF